MNSGDLTEFKSQFGTGLNPVLYNIPVQPGCCPSCKCIRCIYNIGPTGPQGPAGTGGESGITGPQGSQGLQGPQGIRGFIGIIGPDGPTGEIGQTGIEGLQGAQGFQGNTGPIGPIGSQGPVGLQGFEGGFTVLGVNTGSIVVNNLAGSGNVYYSDILKVTNGITGTFQVAGAILPASTDTYSLGSSTAVWNDLFVNTGTIYVGPTGTIKANALGNILLNDVRVDTYSYESLTGNNITLNPNMQSSYVNGVTGTLAVSSVSGFTKTVVNISGTPSIIQVPTGVVDNNNLFTYYNLSLTGSNITLFNNNTSKWVKLSENGAITKS